MSKICMWFSVVNNNNNKYHNREAACEQIQSIEFTMVTSNSASQTIDEIISPRFLILIPASILHEPADL